jgi:prepilin-type N-terminal cleavage/methylation domain-containing protein
MKLHPSSNCPGPNSELPSSARHAVRMSRGFTLTEIMVALSVFTLLVAGLMSAQLMGMRMRKVTETKLESSASARQALNEIRDQVRMARLISVGAGDSEAFKPVADRLPQIGNALQIQATSDTNVFTRYYLDQQSQSLMRISSAERKPSLVASGITNAMVFTAEDFGGRVLTNSQNSRVIRMLFEFRKWEYASASSGRNGVYDYYRLQTRVTRRATD